MGSLLSYSGLATKIRAMQSRLFTEPEYQELSQMTNLSQAVSYIKKHPGFSQLWQDIDESSPDLNEIKQRLTYSIYANYTRIYRFSNSKQRRFLALYFKRYEIQIIKACLRKIFDHRDIHLDLSIFHDFFIQHSKLNLDKLTTSSTIEEFVNNLKGSEYYMPLSHLLNASDSNNTTLFEYGMALDQYYFTLIWKKKEKIFSGADLEEITKAYGRKFDMLNLNWIYRSKRYYHMEPASIYALLIPMQYKLQMKEITALVEASDMEEFGKILSETYYNRLAPELKPESLEQAYVHILRSVLEQAAKRHPHSVAIIYNYLYRKEHESDRLTTAIECIRYGVSPEETMRHIMNN
ncbi:MAG: V0D/AC39 family V-type ATPase subunit [Lachnospiraceae bacterium]|jgi:V/A-type H+-transporting ATPase subunit C